MPRHVQGSLDTPLAIMAFVDDSRRQQLALLGSRSQTQATIGQVAPCGSIACSQDIPDHSALTFLASGHALVGMSYQ